MSKTNNNPTAQNTRRNFLKTTSIAGASVLAGAALLNTSCNNSQQKEQSTSQRLSLKQLKDWEALGYGMFIHFGMSTYISQELPDGSQDQSIYSPDKLDVDQWISVAKQAGMKYAVLTTKHVAGHCLWPSKFTGYSVANSPVKTDVVAAFVVACKKYGIMPGFYYCSWDNHHKFGSRTPSELPLNNGNAKPAENKELFAFTTSQYQDFQTAQITELLTQYGQIGEVWVDIPGVLGAGYRAFLYNHIAKLQPNAIIMMNSGLGNGDKYNVDYAWPSDLIAIERDLPPATGHQKNRTIAGKQYYMPGEACDPIGKEWFYVEGDQPRPVTELAKQYKTLRAAGVNFLLDVPPNKHGLIPESSIQTLLQLKKEAGII